MRCPPVHELAIADALGTVHLPEDVAAEQTCLILELAEASLLRVVSIAGRDYRPDIFGLDRRSVDEDPNLTSALTGALSDALAVRGVRGQVCGAKRALTGAPRDVPTHGTHGVEKLPLA
jgi:hypothetical protein